jgi:RNA polymerase sigma factor (sigma-70 family)
MTNAQESFPHLYSEEIDRRWRLPLMTFFLRRVHDLSDAEDLTQETLSRTVNRVSATENTSVGYYLFTVGSNLLRDRARRSKSHLSKAHDSLFDLKFGMLPSADDQSAERSLIAKENLRRVLIALAELDARTRDIFILFRLENMKQREIASRFGISVSAVEKQIVKASAHLAAQFEDGD